MSVSLSSRVRFCLNKSLLFRACSYRSGLDDKAEAGKRCFRSQQVGELAGPQPGHPVLSAVGTLPATCVASCFPEPGGSGLEQACTDPRRHTERV